MEASLEPPPALLRRDTGSCRGSQELVVQVGFAGPIPVAWARYIRRGAGVNRRLF
jgi:hypothetical protein